MPGRFVANWIDYDGDRLQESIEAIAVTAANHDAEKAAAAALASALEAVSWCDIGYYDFVGEREVLTVVKPSDQQAQVNVQWVIEYVDDTTGEGPYKYRIPGADLSIAGVLQAASNQVDLAEGTMAALVTAFEAYARSPNGNAVDVQRIYFKE